MSMVKSSRRAFVLGMIGATAASMARAQTPPKPPLPLGEVAIQAKTGRHVFKVEIVQTEAERAQGLMFRQRLAANAGMLFDFQDEQLVAFWMKNTLIPLDMIFIRGDGRIANIAQRAVPLSLDAVPSTEAVRFVLEVNGGTASRLGIKAGDRAILPPMPAR